MPTTARLSRRFYDTFGDDVANELVTLLNDVDLAYRTELKETNASNFAVFDAKLDLRFAEQDARLEKRFAEQDAKFEKRFAEQDAKLEKRFAEQDAKFEKRFAEQDAKFEKRFAEQDAKFERRFAEIEVRFDRLKVDMLKWMFAFWATNTAAIVALTFAVLRAR